MALYEYLCLGCGARRERLARSLKEAPEFDRCTCGWTMVKMEISRPGYRRDHTMLTNGD